MADNSTVISIVPFVIEEKKPGLYPGHFRIPAVKDNDIEVLIVGGSVHHVYLDSDRGSLTIPTLSSEVARSIVEDYKGAQLGYAPGVAEPGIFWVQGEFDKKTALATHKNKIDHARVLQRQWFVTLVEVADDEWNKYHSHKMISDLQRYASKFLGMEREWNIQATADANTFCPACRAVLDRQALVCGNCRTIIKPEEYKKANLSQVGA